LESGAPLGLWVDEEIAGAAERGLAVVERTFSLPVRDYTDKDRRIAEAEALQAEVKPSTRRMAIGVARGPELPVQACRYEC
jgi:hypothetical protein